jgi:peptide/nickel transport system substrate-binding protein
MRRLRPLLLGFALSCSLFFAACGRPPEPPVAETVVPLPEDAETVPFAPGEPGALFVETAAGDIATLNPLVSEDNSSSSVIGRFLESLTTLDTTSGEIIPRLAKSWEISPDGLVFTFHLREGLVWSDGEPFTAADVEFTWRDAFYTKELDPATGQPVVDAETGRPRLRFPSRPAYFQMIEGQEVRVEALDRYTVRFTLPQVYAPFLLFGGGVEILPKHILQPHVEKGTLLDAWSINTAINSPRELVGMGPFLLESYRPGERIVFRRNPNYWRRDSAGRRLPYISRIVTRIVGDTNASNVAFAQGRTDAEGIQPDNVTWISAAAEDRDFTVHDLGPSNATSFVWFNLRPGADPDGKPFVAPHKQAWFTDVRFRQALSYAVNRQGIVDGVFAGRAAPLHGYVNLKNRNWHNPDVRRFDYDPERARALLAEAGFVRRGERLFDAGGQPVEFELMTNNNSNLRTEMATVFAENMAALGIRVELQFIDFNTIIRRTSESFNYEACLLGLGGGAPDPYASKDILMSDGRLHFWNPQQARPATEWEARIDELMRQIGRELDNDKRRAAFFEVQEIIAEQQPMIFLVTAKEFVGLKNRWRNVTPTPLGGVLWNFDALWAAPQ